MYKVLIDRNSDNKRDLHIALNSTSPSDLSTPAKELADRLLKKLAERNAQELINDCPPGDNWVSHARFLARDKPEDESMQIFALQAIYNIMEISRPKIDDHVAQVNNHELLESLNIQHNNGLISLSLARIDLLPQGLILDDSKLLFLHPFLRRCFSGNFAGIHVPLQNALNKGHEVEVRIDPTRVSDKKWYQEIIELDHWYGPKFNQDLLNDRFLAERTLHHNPQDDLTYPIKYTIFRTKMMDKRAGLRSISIEEYCLSEVNYYGSTQRKLAPGIGNEYAIQRYAHLVYDQNIGKFEHFDAAVRVFSREDYDEIYQLIDNNGDVDERVGIRYKLFKVSGEIDLDLVEQAMYMWFRYNPLIPEYFSGDKMSTHAL